MIKKLDRIRILMTCQQSTPVLTRRENKAKTSGMGLERWRLPMQIANDSADLFRHVSAEKATFYRCIMDVFAAAKRHRCVPAAFVTAYGPLPYIRPVPPAPDVVARTWQCALFSIIRGTNALIA